MNWQDRRDIAQAAREEKREEIARNETIDRFTERYEQEREKRTHWEEYDVHELGRLMMDASELEDSVLDLGPTFPTGARGPGSDHDLIADAQYHARKLYMILAHLAVKSNREWREIQAEEAAKE